MSLLASSGALSRFPATAEKAYDTKNPLFTDKSEITVAMRHEQQLEELEKLAKQEYLAEELRDIRREVHRSLKRASKQGDTQKAQNAVEQREIELPETAGQTARLGRSFIEEAYRRDQAEAAPPSKCTTQWWEKLDCSLKNEEYLSKSQRVYGIAPVAQKEPARREEQYQDLEELIECSVYLVDQNRLLFAQHEHAVLNSACSMLQGE